MSARAFGFVRYNSEEVGDPGKLLAPPYDIVSEAQRNELADVSPFQSIWLESPENNDTKLSAERFQQWLRDDVLEAGEVGLAVIKQRYVGPDGARRSRIGVVCEVGLRDFGDGVLPHERTFDAPRKLRYQLMKDTRANISPVFVVYNDSGRSLHDVLSSVTDDVPDMTATDAAGTQTAVWIVTDPVVCDQFSDAVGDKTLLIADGHHRYTAALEYQREHAKSAQPMSVVGGTDHTGSPHTESSGANGVLAVVANSADEGMSIFPTYRVVEGIDIGLIDEFIVGSGALAEQEFVDIEAATAALNALPVPGFIAWTSSSIRLLSVPEASDLELAAPGTSAAYRSLDVVALHSLLIDGGAMLGESAAKIRYVQRIEAVYDAIQANERTAGFLIRATPVEAVFELAAAGDVLPQKSTYFFPKVPTGVLFRPLVPLV